MPSPSADSLMGRGGSETDSTTYNERGADRVLAPKISKDGKPEAGFTVYMQANPRCECLIGVGGGWYDVTSFRFRHPGGPLLMEKCHGKDATELVQTFHHRDVMKGWKPVCRYDQNMNEKHEVDGRTAKAFRALHDEFTAKGFFKTSMSWYAGTIALAFLFPVLCCALVKLADTSSALVAAVGGVLLGLFWQQSAWIMHDCMHNQFTHRRTTDRWVGMFFGSFCLGVSAHWWRDEHFQHHAYANVVDKATLHADPQMQEEMWVQSPLLFPLAKDWGHPALTWIQKQLFALQHFFFIPFCILAGRLDFVISIVVNERRWYEVATLALHNLCLCLFTCYSFPTWKTRCIFIAVACMLEGVLHIQLLISHYAKPWTEMSDIFTKIDWYRMQIYCNINIKSPWWMDWFHGGLNFHIEHHLFPTMPRHRFREISVRVKEVCAEHDVPYDECFWFEAVWRTLKHLREIADLYEKSQSAEALAEATRAEKKLQ